MKAIVDCNSFYCSCERLFRPDLQQRPVVVLSNNDGCIVSRTDEAKQIGIQMAGPYFIAKPMIEQYGVSTFSSNYHLYGDLSHRVMDTLRAIVGINQVEVYSVDEAFLDLKAVPTHDLNNAALQIKETVEQWTGIAVSVGVARTKTLSKLANRLAKKNKLKTKGVVVLENEVQEAAALERTPVEDVWGIGGSNAAKLQQFNINNALQLKQMPLAWVRKNLGGVVGERLLKELHGEESILMKDPLETKKMIATTRMFGQPVNSLQDVKEAVATYTSRAAEKLRRQYSAATAISVFVVPKELSHQGNFKRGTSLSDYTTLPFATSVTQELIKPALQLVDTLFEEGRFYKKAGVMLSGLVPDKALQGNLFAAPAQCNGSILMQALDNINFAMRDDVLKFASSGTKRDWKMRQELRSKRYTTRWDELFEVG